MVSKLFEQYQKGIVTFIPDSRSKKIKSIKRVLKKFILKTTKKKKSSDSSGELLEALCNLSIINQCVCSVHSASVYSVC